jgi:hypothetical protein
MTTPCASFEIRCNEDFVANSLEMFAWLNGVAKHFTFQKERGDGGYVHWQGRISLIKKRRKPELITLLVSLGKKIPNYLEPTVLVEHRSGDMFYAQKEDTRIEGPWTDRDKPTYIPRQIRDIKQLYPWQQQIVNDASVWNTRTINLVYCPVGNKGKTTLVGWCRAYGIARVLPSVNECKDLLRMVCDMPTSTMYLFDMPRSMNKERLYGFFSAIETIKDGYAYDDRYAFKEKSFDCPNIWIFSNSLPDFNMLSTDRWKIWEIDASNSLKLFSHPIL